MVTLVLFTGDEWDCAADLNGMFAIPKNFMVQIPSWQLHIVDPHKMSDEEIMKMDSNDMKFFMSVVKYGKDKEKLKEISEKYFNQFYVSPQVCYITGVVTKTKWLRDRYKNRRDEVVEDENMCLAFEEWEKEARTEGKAEGLAEGIAEGKLEGRAEGLVEGKLEGKAEGVNEERKRNVLSMHSKDFSADEIARILDIDSGEVKDIISLFRS